jgi:hypothetical protein
MKDGVDAIYNVWSETDWKREGPGTGGGGNRILENDCSEGFPTTRYWDASKAEAKTEDQPEGHSKEKSKG